MGNGAMASRRVYMYVLQRVLVLGLIYSVISDNGEAREGGRGVVARPEFETETKQQYICKLSSTNVKCVLELYSTLQCNKIEIIII